MSSFIVEASNPNKILFPSTDTDQSRWTAEDHALQIELKEVDESMKGNLSQLQKVLKKARSNFELSGTFTVPSAALFY